MDQKLNFKTTTNCARWGVKKGACVAHAIHNKIVGVDEIATELAERLGQSPLQARCAVELMCNLLAENVAAGNRVELPAFSISLSITGTLESANAKFDPSRNKISVNIKPSAALVACTESLEPKNVTADVSPVLYEVEDDKLGANKIGLGNRVVVNGSNIAITPDADDEGAWLENEAGERLLKADVLESNASTLHCRFTGSLERGSYTLALSVRNGKPLSKSPSVVRRHVQVA